MNKHCEQKDKNYVVVYERIWDPQLDHDIYYVWHVAENYFPKDTDLSSFQKVKCNQEKQCYNLHLGDWIE